MGSFLQKGSWEVNEPRVLETWAWWVWRAVMAALELEVILMAEVMMGGVGNGNDGVVVAVQMVGKQGIGGKKLPSMKNVHRDRTMRILNTHFNCPQVLHSLTYLLLHYI